MNKHSKTSVLVQSNNHDPNFEDFAIDIEPENVPSAGDVIVTRRLDRKYVVRYRTFQIFDNENEAVDGELVLIRLFVDELSLTEPDEMPDETETT